MHFDLVVIGGGPGGYVAAIRGAQRGLKVALVEKAIPGGVCLNWGCIPSKSLIHHANDFRSLQNFESLGISLDKSGFRYANVQSKSREAAATLANGVTGLLKKNGVRVFKAAGKLASANEVILTGGENDGDMVVAKNIIIATGSRPLEVPGFKIDEEKVLSSTGLLAMTILPKSLLILGGGAIGCEFAYVMNAFGVKVTLLEMANQLLPQSDSEIAAVLADRFTRDGIEIRTECRALKLERGQANLSVKVSHQGTEETLMAEKVLCAFGRSPNSDCIGIENLGIELDGRGYIVSGDYCQTNLAGIYAIGDVSPGLALAHVASKEAEIVIDHILGEGTELRVDSHLVPTAVYCEPQIAAFGLTEAECQEHQLAFRKSVFPFRAVGKAVATETTGGFVKILAEEHTGEILGAHIIGKDATELIHVLLLAKSSELLIDDVESMIYAHPTLSEAILEASKGIFGRPVHL